MKSRIVADCIVGDVHRIMKRGGLFVDAPMPEENEQGGGESISFRLAPVSFLLKQAGGSSSNGSVPLLELEPKTYKSTSPAILGSKDLVERLQETVRKLGDLLESASMSRSTNSVEAPPTADVRQLIGGGATNSSLGDEEKRDNVMAGEVDLRTEPRRGYFP